MPTYVYRCPDGHHTETDYTIGHAPRHRPCTCGQDSQKVLGVGLHIGAGALPNKRAGIHQIDRTQAEWDRDLPAYKRMADEGLQPKSTHNAAAVERQTYERGGDQFAIDYEAALAHGPRTKVEDAVGELTEAGLI